MSWEDKLKGVLSRIWNVANTRRRKVTMGLKARKFIRNSAEPVPQLTEEQSSAVKALWGKYGYSFPMHWHRLYYAKTGVFDPSFVPEYVFLYQIRTAMNDMTFATAWSDKAYLDRYISDVKTPTCVVRNVNGTFLDDQYRIIGSDEIRRIMDAHEKLVVKPSVLTDTGKGVQLLQHPYDLDRLQAQYQRDYVIQIPLEQHPEMSKLNATSVNTIRFNTVLLDSQAYVMSAFVKVGQTGAFADNSGHDRYFIGINPDGTYKDYAIDHDLNRYEAIPSGYYFAGQKVPSYDKLCDAVIRAHRQIPRFGFAFWDVSVDKDGEPVIVEMNLRKPDANVPQAAVGPFLGTYTEAILMYLQKNGKRG